jgi:hypothetical protein
LTTFASAAIPPSFWNAPSGDSKLYLMIGITLLIGFAFVISCLFMPSRMRRPIAAGATFLAGLFWVLYWIWPTARDKTATDIPDNFTESVAFWLSDAVPHVSNFANILTAFILGLGIYSILRIHGKRFIKMQKDWPFSLILLLALVSMFIFGILDWKDRLGEGGSRLQDEATWGFVQFGRDMLFDGLLQTLDAAMFSMIAFFILSAAYRAFRIRSIEATILLAAALIVMVSLMGLVVFYQDQTVGNMAGNDPNSFVNNFKLSVISGWIRGNIQTPAIRAIEFGIGIGALAMGLRLWLSLERGASAR